MSKPAIVTPVTVVAGVLAAGSVVLGVCWWNNHGAPVAPAPVLADASAATAPPASGNAPAQADTAPSISAVAPPQMVNVDGVRYEQSDIVTAFLGLQERCSPSISMTLLDFLRVREMGAASPPMDYEVTSEMDGDDRFVIVREELLSSGRRPFKGAPGYVVHRYYYNAPMERFEYVKSEPEDPSYSPSLLYALGNPMGFFLTHPAPVCNAWFALPEHRQSAAADSTANSSAAAKPR